MFTSSVHIVTCCLTFGEYHRRLRTSRPSRGALMRRHEGGAGPTPAGVVRSCTPGRTPEQPRRLLSGRRGSGHRGTRKREKPVARWTGAYLLLASALARHTPSLWGERKKRRALPRPHQVRDQHSVGYAFFIFRTVRTGCVKAHQTMTVILRRERRRHLPAPEPRRATARASPRTGAASFEARCARASG